ncbi:hypothetical protein E2320_006382 [Naja naja]|nr:hypothetical protein E2320_006382 [Naja naja]
MALPGSSVASDLGRSSTGSQPPPPTTAAFPKASMSGGIFTPLESLCELDNANCHPLVCFLCHEHHQSVVKGNGLPPEDQLLKFLVDSSGDYEEDVLCANCDLQSTKQELDAMYFCNTCSQPLCARCREETHKARMFSRHEIVSLSKRAKEVHKKCPLHEELYIMFSTEKKSMLCINCFRDMPVESRAHCIDIETAYMRGCEKLDQAVMAVKELQTSTREAIVLLKAMIEEVRNSADEESSAINALFGSMQYEEKEKAFKEQLSHLASLLPTLQVHLVTCSAFLSSANKAEFLDLGYINSEYRAEFAHCLEPLLPLSPRWSVVGTAGAIGPGLSNSNMMSGVAGSKTLLATGCSSSLDKMPLAGSPVRKATMHRYISTKVLLAEGRETPFTDHCRDYENTYRALQSEIQSLKDQVQELHRDLTKHHSLIRTENVSEILQKSLQVDVQIASQFSSVEMRRAEFEETWEETYQRVANEQEIYEAQLHDLLQLRQENSYLTAITKQIGPYVRSIARVKERLEPSSATMDPQPKLPEVFKNKTKMRAETPSDPMGLTKEGDLETQLLLH